MNEDDQIRRECGAAGIIRAIEILKKTPITREQYLAFKHSYTGNYSEEILDMGMSFILRLRKKRGNLLTRGLTSLTSKKTTDARMRDFIERMANNMLKNPEVRKSMEDVIASDFGRRGRSGKKSVPHVVSLAKVNREQRRGIKHAADLMASFILSLDSLFEGRSKLGEVERSDATLFDLGCYLLFRIDLYLFKQHRDVRDRISKELSELFVNLFEEAFDESIGIKYDQRIDLYDELIKTTTDPCSYHNRIEQMMLLATRNGAPQDYSITTPLLFHDALAQHPFKLALLEWEKSELVKCLNDTKTHLWIFQRTR